MIPAEAVEAAARVMLDKMYNDKTLRVDDEDRDIMRETLEAAAPHMHAYLLAELRDRDEKLARVEGLCDDWDIVHETFPRAAGGIFAKSHANQIRAAIAAAKGDDRG